MKCLFENGYVDGSFEIFFRTKGAYEIVLGCRVFKMLFFKMLQIFFFFLEIPLA